MNDNLNIFGLDRDRTRLEDIEPRIRRRRLALFGHVARIPPGVPAHDAFWSVLEVRCGSAPDPDWKLPLVGVQEPAGPSS